MELECRRFLRAQVLAVARLLGELASECVFLGGAATALLVTDSAAPDVRPTLDVDVVVELATLPDYYRFQDKLRAKGFGEDMTSGVICRWRHGAVILDVMPTEPGILGFANPWYRGAVRFPLRLDLEGVPLLVASPAYFLATKLEAFRARGEGDYMASHDMEDVVALLDGRPTVVGDVTSADQEVREHLRERMAALLADDAFLDALPGHLPPDAASQARMPLILDRMRAIAALS